MTELNKENIKETIIATFERLQKLVDNHQNPNVQPGEGKIKIVDYPNGNGMRISEQEVRFLFIETLLTNESLNVYYSIETPTEHTYRFTQDRRAVIPRLCDDGKSAQMDLTLFDSIDKRQPEVIIEFKAGNATLHEYDKDFCKLNNEDYAPIRVFINIFKSFDNDTKESLEEKFRNLNNPLSDDVVFIGYILGNDGANGRYVTYSSNNGIVQQPNW